jgi:hypothetical protein
MGQGAALRGIRVFAVAAALVAVPSAVFAHAQLISPKPRTANDGIKIPPCGNIPKTASFTQYDAGALITVQWREGIDHSGCFDFVLATTGQVGDAAADPQTGDKWMRLKRVPDDGGTANTNFTTTVQLPPGVTCENCTLALRQIMANSNPGGICPGGQCICAANTPDEMDGGPPTYFSCADIRIGDFPDAAPSADAGDNDSGTSTTPTDGGGKVFDGGDPGSSSSSSGGAPRRLSGGDDGGCSVGWNASTGAALFMVGGIGVLAVMRRRRKR